MPIKNYSTTPGSNTSLFPEGMNPAAVNDGMRQVQADIRSFYNTLEFRDLGDVPTYISGTSFTVPGDQTSFYTVGRRIKIAGSVMSTVYATIATSIFSAGITTVTYAVDSGTVDNTINSVSVGIDTSKLATTEFGTVGGTANALTFTFAIAPVAYTNGMVIRGYATNTNTNTTTINVNGLGVKTIKLNSADLPASTFVVGTYFEAVYNSTTGFFDLVHPISVQVGPANITTALGQVYRSKAPPTISNNVADANNDIDVAGSVYFGTDAGVILQSTAFTKRLDALWTVGNNGGGLDAGSKANSTNYSVWAIYNPATQILDYLFSTHATAPTMPSGYTDKRRIGWIRTDAAGSILPFKQIKDSFFYTTPIQVNVAVNSTRTTISLPSAPPSTRAKVRISAPSNASTVFQSVYEADTAAPSNTLLPLSNIFSTNGLGVGEFEFQLDNNSQIYGRNNVGATTVHFLVLGFVDNRGRDD